MCQWVIVIGSLFRLQLHKKEQLQPVNNVAYDQDGTQRVRGGGACVALPLLPEEQFAGEIRTPNPVLKM